jgi:type VI secretion system protein ImpH
MLERSRPDAALIGQLGPAGRESVWFRHDPRLIFAAGDVTSVLPQGQRIVITTTFIGLTGATSPLANFFAEDVIRSDEAAGEALAAFYDLFHHRITSFIYRAWAKYRPMPQFRPGGEDPFTRRALCLIGVAPDTQIAKGALPPFVQLSLAPVLVGRVRSARALELVLARVFPGTPMHIECFVERRVVLDDVERTKLGRVKTTLGEDFTIGRSVRDRSGRFRVRVGPVDQANSERFLPGGQDFPRLRGVVEHFTRGVLEAEMDVELDESATPRFRLATATGARLGVTTRIGTKAQGRTRLRVLLSDDMDDVRPTVVPAA